MTMFVTGNLQLCSDEVASARGFKDAKKHDQDLMEAWYEQVRPEDDVWILGNLSTEEPHKVLGILPKLPGKKHLIIGPGDLVSPEYKEAWKLFPVYAEIFQNIQTVARRRLHGNNCYLSHYYPSTPKTLTPPVWRPHGASCFWVVAEKDISMDHEAVYQAEVPQGPMPILNVSWGTWMDLVPWDEVKTHLHPQKTDD